MEDIFKLANKALRHDKYLTFLRRKRREQRNGFGQARGDKALPHLLRSCIKLRVHFDTAFTRVFQHAKDQLTNRP